MRLLLFFQFDSLGMLSVRKPCEDFIHNAAIPENNDATCIFVEDLRDEIGVKC